MKSRRYTPPLVRGGKGEPLPDYLTRPETWKYLRISEAYLAELTASGAIPSLKLGYRRLYRRADLDAWMDSKVIR